MITFFISIIGLFLGYYFYSKVVVRIFGVKEERETPAITLNDGVDFVPLPLWKIFLIQFLNIAGLGPIFGAVAGAMWGPIAFLWIVLGSVFAGGVHDFFSGMLSVRNNGKGIAEMTGLYMGKTVKQFMRGFTVFLLTMVGTVFVVGPAKILDGLTSGYVGYTWWVWIILLYYVVATLLPIDKIIGKVYPFFGFTLLIMAFGLAIPLIFGSVTIPELTLSTFNNLHHTPGNFPVFPMVFITIACGAISGFHATQSPLMARCLTNENQGRLIFYGAMITEGMVALIWAAIAMSFYGGVKELNQVMSSNGENAALVVNEISNGMLGKFGGILALLGVVAAPLTSGDTSFRSARLIMAEFLKLNQVPMANRMYLSLPLFVLAFLISKMDFGVIWRYFAWTNQTLAAIVLWTITLYLIQERKPFWITFIPAMFMTMVVSSYILVAPEGFQLPVQLSNWLALAVTLAVSLTVVKNRFLKKEWQGTPAQGKIRI